MPEPLSFKWEWDLSSPPLLLWPYLSDTNRFNRDAGLPAVEPAENGSNFSNKILRSWTAGMLIEWEEKPFEWIIPFEFGVERNYKKGPLSLAKIKVCLRPQGQGTHLIYESLLTPRNFLMKAALYIKMKCEIQPKLSALLKSYESQIAGKFKKIKEIPFLRNSLLAEFSKLSPEAAHLAFHIENAADLDLVRIRPYELAKKWGFKNREMLETFLTAAHQHLLEFQWEIICPHCRGSEKRGPSLEIISQEGYCKSCDLHYTVNFDQLIELTFRPNPKIRKISAGFFCTGGPMVTPHILVQKTAAPWETLRFTLSAGPGVYRLRGVRLKNEAIFSVEEDAGSAPIFKINQEKIAGPSEISAKNLEWSVENTAGTPLLFAVEELKWAENRVSGRDVIHMRLFRELFQTQCLRPNQPISSGELTIAFTDLKGSTKMYQEIGDPTAFCQVLNHFDILQDIVSAHDGTIIKTIGDSVMAVFDSPAKALLAMAAAQKALAKPSLNGQRPLCLKIGIHKGSHLVVNLNNRLDYFGSSVNIAARLVNFSSGEDIIISSEMAADEQTAIFLENPNSGFLIEKIQTEIRGFGKESFTLFRLRPR